MTLKKHLWADKQSLPAWAGLLATWFPGSAVLPVGRGALGLAALLKSWRGTRSLCKVALPGSICHEVVIAILEAGCEPLFCDIDIATGLVPDSEWAKTRELGAEVAIVVHLYGNPARTNSVRALFPAPSCLLIDDAAQALGSRSSDAMAGAAGDVGLLSFGVTKQISVGHAALLVHASSLADPVRAELEKMIPETEEVRHRLAAQFRANLDAVRQRLITHDDQAASDFVGLLDGMGGLLRVGLSSAIDEKLTQSLKNYPENMAARVTKAARWSEYVTQLGLRPVGMGAGCIPWRFVWRLPGIDWATQHRLAEALRREGMHVSSWYLPAHWFVGHSPGSLPGVERFAREVFQFWVDETVTEMSINRDAAVLASNLSYLRIERFED